jgi:glycosyltransferase involved in cell wall biosynthesis
MKPKLSIIIPAFNEEARIGKTLDLIFDFMVKAGIPTELIVVDDGSGDRTSLIADQHLRVHPDIQSRVLRYDTNKGKGYAVRLGLENCSGDVALFSDADLSTPIEELSNLLDPINRDDCDLAFGSRALDRSMIGKRQSWRREQGGRVFNLIVRLFTGLNALDTQCGFKAFRMSKFRPLLPCLVIDRFGFDVEMLVAAQQAGLRLKEVPVRWDNDDRSKVSFLRDSIRMFQEVLVIRKRIKKGAYKVETTP